MDRQEIQDIGVDGNGEIPRPPKRNKGHSLLKRAGIPAALTVVPAALVGIMSYELGRQVGRREAADSAAATRTVDSTTQQTRDEVAKFLHPSKKGAFEQKLEGDLWEAHRQQRDQVDVFRESGYLGAPIGNGAQLEKKGEDSTLPTDPQEEKLIRELPVEPDRVLSLAATYGLATWNQAHSDHVQAVLAGSKGNREEEIEYYQAALKKFYALAMQLAGEPNILESDAERMLELTQKRIEYIDKKLKKLEGGEKQQEQPSTRDGAKRSSGYRSVTPDGPIITGGGYVGGGGATTEAHHYSDGTTIIYDRHTGKEISRTTGRK